MNGLDWLQLKVTSAPIHCCRLRLKKSAWKLSWRRVAADLNPANALKAMNYMTYYGTAKKLLAQPNAAIGMVYSFKDRFNRRTIGQSRIGGIA